MSVFLISGNAAAVTSTWDLKITNDALKGLTRASLSTKVSAGNTAYEIALKCASDSTAQTTLTFYDRNTGRGKSPSWRVLYDETSASQAQFSYRIGNHGINSGFMKRDGAGIAGLGERRGYANVANIDNHWMKIEDIAGENSLALGGIFSDESFVVPLQWSTDKFKKFACVCAANKPPAGADSKGTSLSDPNFAANIMSLAEEIAGMGMNRVIDIEKLGNIGGCPVAKKIKPIEAIKKAPIVDDASGVSDLNANNDLIFEGAAVQSSRDQAPPPGIDKNYQSMSITASGKSLGYYDAIQNVLEKNVRYPDKAKKNGIEGSCRVSIRISRGGDIKNIETISSSGSDILDEECQNVFMRISKFPLAPESVPAEFSEFIVELPINFSLNYN